MKLKVIFTAGIFFGMISCSDTSSETTRDNSIADTTVRSADSTKIFNLAEARTTIDAINAKFVEDVKKGDSNALASYYHSEAQMMMPNYQPIKKADIAGAMGGMMRMGIKSAALTINDLTGNDELLLETGTYQMFDSANKKLDEGKTLVAWKKENGQWRIYRDMISTNLPMNTGHK